MGTDGKDGGHGLLFSIFDLHGQGTDFERSERSGGKLMRGTGLFNHGFQGREFCGTDQSSATRRMGRNDCKPWRQAILLTGMLH
jgi:hypothetical protein